jgi:Tfp pilus assembly protein PilF
MRFVRLPMMAFCGLLFGCAAVPPRVATQSPVQIAPEPVAVRPELFGDPIVLPPVGTLYQLTEPQKEDFLAFFTDPAHAEFKPHERIFRYLEGRLGNFRYHGDTLTASQALALDQGNCLSLALVTTALAQLVDVEARYQRVLSTPVFERHGGFVAVADHVRTRLYDPTYVPQEGQALLQAPHLIIDYFPTIGQRSGSRVDLHELQSMYYVNLAAEALSRSDFRASYWMLVTALEHDEANPDAMNSLAVLHRRVGAEDAAERLYRQGLRRHGDNLNLLNNLRRLLLTQERLDEVAEIDAKLARLPNHDPYRLIELGNEAVADKRARSALSYYAQAVEMAPYLHEAYWRMAVAYDALGQQALAERWLRDAYKTAPRDPDRDRYRAKLHTLQSTSMH